MMSRWISMGLVSLVGLVSLFAGCSLILDGSDEGDPPGAPQVTMLPPQVDFGPVVIETSSGLVTVTIIAADPVEDDVVLEESEVFTLVGDDCSGRTLGKTEACTIELVFEPVVEVQSDGIVHFGTSSVTLTGIGVAASALVADPSPLTFGVVPLQQSPEMMVTLENTGLDPISMIEVEVDPPYAVDLTGCLALGVGLTCDVPVTFSPIQHGDASSSIEFKAMADGQPIGTPLPVSGFGRASAFPLTVVVEESGLVNINVDGDDVSQCTAGGSCTMPVDNGATVVLRPNTPPMAWGGVCAGTQVQDPCTFTMSMALTAVATYQGSE